MTDTLRRARLFLGSYALLFALLALRFDGVGLEFVCAFLAGLGIFDMVHIVFHVAKTSNPEPLRLVLVEDAGSDVAGYLATYLLPFLTVAQPSWRDLVAYSIFIFVGGLIFVRSDMAQINPTLYMLGQRVLRVSSEHGWEGYLISPTMAKKDDVVHAISINDVIRVRTREAVVADNG